jgi:hypothetical protein
MPTQLVPYPSNPLVRDRRAIAEAREARRPARRAAVRVEAAAHVALTGLVFTEALTSLEAEVCRRQGALVDDRARRIVDGYVHCVQTELALLPMRGE